MKIAIGLLAAAALLPSAFGAAVSSFTGTFTADDNIQVFDISLGADSSLTVQTFGYAGGTNGNADLIPAGGFDPALALFSPSGSLIATNDDGGCGTVNADPVTGQCLDSFLAQANLTSAGVYILTLTESPNRAQDNFGLADTFPDPPGTGNFTCAAFGGNPDSPFCDWTGAQRNGNWAVDISASQLLSASESAAPEPGSFALITAALALFAIRRRPQSSTFE